MGMTVVDSGIVVAGEATRLSSISSVGAAIGSVFATVALVYALAYLDLADAAEADYDHIKRMLVGCILPLFFVFLGVIMFEVLQIIITFA